MLRSFPVDSVSVVHVIRQNISLQAEWKREL